MGFDGLWLSLLVLGLVFMFSIPVFVMAANRLAYHGTSLKKQPYVKEMKAELKKQKEDKKPWQEEEKKVKVSANFGKTVIKNSAGEDDQDASGADGKQDKGNIVKN